MFRPMTDSLSELRDELREIEDLSSIDQLMEWDQQTQMPEGGAVARGRQMALIGKLVHQRRTSTRLGDLLGSLRSVQDEDSADGALVRRATRDFMRARRLPTDFVTELKEHTAASYVAWTKAKPNNDFASIAPVLEKTVELSRRLAGFFPDQDHVADPLIDEHDPGMTVASIQSVFSGLRKELVPLANAIFDKQGPRRDFLSRSFPIPKQYAFNREVIEALGYDFSRGRIDEAAHPFMIRFAAGDIRITTRAQEHDPTDSLYSTIHEAGHALYEQNIAAALDGTPLGHGTSTGVHESQSRLWENRVGRSRAFWDRFFPRFQETFPEALKDVDAEAMYRAINTVERSLIRVDADEVTYNLHVMLRFDLELQLLTGELKVRDLPEAWNARMKSDLGVVPETDTVGVLQDIHWYCTTVGGTFQGYALGNIMSAQFYDAALKSSETIERDVARGDFTQLRGWLVENVYQHGGRYLPDALIQNATGAPLTHAPFMRYLETKFGELYDL